MAFHNRAHDDSDIDVAVILPTYCEADSIGRIIDTIEKIMPKVTILVVDDSSPDHTAKTVEDLQKKYPGILLMSRPNKMGLGTAIRDGFGHLLSRTDLPDYIVTMDSDFSHDPQEIPRITQLAREGYDIVIGSRYCKGGRIEGWEFHRKLVSRIANRITRRIVRLPISDFTSGFRCYSTDCVRRMLSTLHSQTYQFQIETLRRAYIQKSRVIEAPIVFVNRKKGRSKLTLAEVWAFYWYVLRTIFKNPNEG